MRSRVAVGCLALAALLVVTFKLTDEAQPIREARTLAASDSIGTRVRARTHHSVFSPTIESAPAPPSEYLRSSRTSANRWRQQHSIWGGMVNAVRKRLGVSKYRPPERLWADEPRDEAWAAAQEGRLRAVLMSAASQLPAPARIAVERVECRTTACRVRFAYAAGTLSDQPARPTIGMHPEVFLGSSSVVTALVAFTGPLAEVTATLPERRNGDHQSEEVVLLWSSQE